MTASFTTPSTAARTNSDWSKRTVTFRSFGKRDLMAGIISLMLAAISIVLVLPFFRIDMSTERRPPTCTMFVCGDEPSCTCATSRT